MFLLSQTSRLSCICSSSSSLILRFLFSFMSSFSCRACWSKLLALFLRPNSARRYSRALFLCERSRTSFRNCCSSACLFLRSSSEAAMLSIWSCFFLPESELSSRWQISMNWLTLWSSFLTSSSCWSRLGGAVLLVCGSLVLSRILLTVSPSSYNSLRYFSFCSSRAIIIFLQSSSLFHSSFISFSASFFLSISFIIFAHTLTIPPYIQNIFKIMTFPILTDYEQRFPACSALLASLPDLYHKKLWNELTLGCLELVYHPSAKGKITFGFYNDFVKRFQKNIDQINLLKLIRESIASLSNKELLEFLAGFEKEASAEDAKILLVAFQGYFSIPDNLGAAHQAMNKLKTFIETHRDVDSYIYSSYYRLCYSFYAAKGKYKLFYSSALQFLAYTQPQELEEKERLVLLFDMAVAVLVSEEIYNFSELLEQPLLVELKNSQHAWLYELIQIFNRGDIALFAQADLKNDVLRKNSKNLEQKIRLMAFLELAFNLPKSNRVVSFEKLSKICGIPVEHVEFMVMKAMALQLVRGSIDQINQEVTISWVAPKVLQAERISTMLRKFQEWEEGVKNVELLMQQTKA